MIGQYCEYDKDEQTCASSLLALSVDLALTVTRERGRRANSEEYNKPMERQHVPRIADDNQCHFTETSDHMAYDQIGTSHWILGKKDGSDV